MLNRLKKIPDTTGPFRLMDEWSDVQTSPRGLAAESLYQAGNKDYCNLPLVNQERSPEKLLAFLRFDYKKTLIRARYLYIDRICNPQTRILSGDDLNFAFFEPILICFPNLEFVGRLLFSKEIDWTQNKTKAILCKVLEQMGPGYKEHAESLVNWHRHALSHELRPDGQWTYDLNTENLYSAPRVVNDGQIYLNIPHFIDSCILEIEKICDVLASDGKDEIMNKFSEYVAKRFEG